MGPEPAYRDGDTLRELYVEKGLSLEQIAEKFDKAPSTIYNWLDRNGIETSTWDSAEERFERQYEIDGETGCWVWTGARHGYGYGQIGVDGATVGAHRWSYKHHNGEIPDGAFICHTCHNPPCVNPDHLYAGDAKTNAEDMVEAGRVSRQFGEDGPMSKLTEAEVVDIRETYSGGGTTVKSLADEYDVSMGTISRAINGDGWPHVGGPIDTDTHARMGKKGEDNNHSELTEVDVRSIRSEYAEGGVTMAELSERYDTSSTNICDIVNRNTWQHVG